MKKIETKITIQAPRDEVWNHLTDFRNYNSWNPFIIHFMGDLKKGNRIEVIMKLEESKEVIFKPIITEVSDQKEFRWMGHLWVKGIFDGEHYFLLRTLESGETELVHGEYFRGILSGVLYKMIGKKTESGFRSMNLALKNRIELLNSIRNAS